MGRKKCQCGATPIIREIRDVRKGYRMAVVRERLECPFCGNMTAPHKSRQQMVGEWESAGWCGQAEVRELREEAE